MGKIEWTKKTYSQKQVICIVLVACISVFALLFYSYNYPTGYASDVVSDTINDIVSDDSDDTSEDDSDDLELGTGAIDFQFDQALTDMYRECFVDPLLIGTAWFVYSSEPYNSTYDSDSLWNPCKEIDICVYSKATSPIAEMQLEKVGTYHCICGAELPYPYCESFRLHDV